MWACYLKSSSPAPQTSPPWPPPPPPPPLPGSSPPPSPPFSHPPNSTSSSLDPLALSSSHVDVVRPSYDSDVQPTTCSWWKRPSSTLSPPPPPSPTTAPPASCTAPPSPPCPPPSPPPPPWTSAGRSIGGAPATQAEKSASSAFCLTSLSLGAGATGLQRSGTGTITSTCVSSSLIELSFEVPYRTSISSMQPGTVELRKCPGVYLGTTFPRGVVAESGNCSAVS